MYAQKNVIKKFLANLFSQREEFFSLIVVGQHFLIHFSASTQQK